MRGVSWVAVAVATTTCLGQQGSAQVRGGADNASWTVEAATASSTITDHPDPYEGIDLLDVEAVVARARATADPGDTLDFVSLREMLFRAAEEGEELDTEFLRKMLRQSEVNLEALEASMEALDPSFADEVIIDDVITDYKYVHSLYTNVSAADFESPMWENQPRLLASLDKDARAGEVLSADEALSAQDKMLIEAFAAFRAREAQMDRDLMGTAKLSQAQLRRNNDVLQDTQNGGFPVYVDPSQPRFIKRKLQGNLAGKYTWVYPTAQPDGVQITLAPDRRSVRVPCGKPLFAGYAREWYSDTGFVIEKERGMTNVQWDENLLSVVTDNPAIGWAEKSHAHVSTSQDIANGPKQWHTHSADAVMVERINRARTSPVIDQTAKRKSSKRDKMVVVAMLAGKIGDALLSAGKDHLHEQKMRSYAKAGGGTLGIAQKKASQEYTRILNEAKTALTNKATARSIRAENHCLHIEQVPNNEPQLVVTKVGTPNHDARLAYDYFDAPLNKNLVAVRGSITMSPGRQFNYLHGTVFMEFVQDVGLVVHYTITSHALFWDNQQLVDNDRALRPGALYLSPIDAIEGNPAAQARLASNLQYKVPSKDGRNPAKMILNKDGSLKQLADFPKVAKYAINYLLTAPADYYRYWSTFAEICPQELRNQVANVFNMHVAAKSLKNEAYINFREAQGLLQFVDRKVKLNMATANMYRRFISDQLALLGMVTKNLDCGARYIKADLPGTHAYNPLELAVWGHFQSEAPRQKVMDISTATMWNANAVLPRQKMWLYKPPGANYATLSQLQVKVLGVTLNSNGAWSKFKRQGNLYVKLSVTRPQQPEIKIGKTKSSGGSKLSADFNQNLPIFAWTNQDGQVNQWVLNVKVWNKNKIMKNTEITKGTLSFAQLPAPGAYPRDACQNTHVQMAGGAGRVSLRICRCDAA